MEPQSGAFKCAPLAIAAMQRKVGLAALGGRCSGNPVTIFAALGPDAGFDAAEHALAGNAVWTPSRILIDSSLIRSPPHGLALALTVARGIAPGLVSEGQIRTN